VDFARGAVDDLGAGADEHAHREHSAFADDDAFDDFAARADEGAVFDDDRAGLKRFKHAADAHATRQVYALADLGARTDGGPCVDHRTFADIGADVDERGHQHNILADEGTGAGNGAGDDAETAFAELGIVIAVELAGHLVSRGARCAAGHDGIVVQAERQQHGLLQPLIDDPFAVDLFRHARAPDSSRPKASSTWARTSALAGVTVSRLPMRPRWRRQGW
jgi:hypothetical protein